MAREYINVYDHDFIVPYDKKYYESLIDKSELKCKNVITMPIIATPYMKNLEFDIEGARAILAYPSPECTLEYFERYISRGDAPAKVRAFYTQIETFHDMANEIANPNIEKIIMKPREYLSEALIKNGVELIENA